MSWRMHKIALTPGEAEIFWGKQHVATVRKEVALQIFDFLHKTFPEGPPEHADMDAIEAKLVEAGAARGPREMIAVEKALKERGEKP